MKKCFIFLVILFFWSFCFGTYKKSAEVQYKTSDGWSDVYNVEVNFLMGSELNKSTNSLKYSSYSLYAVIFWNDTGSASVIEIEGLNTCYETVKKDCIENKTFDWEGKDEKGRLWNICTSSYCTEKTNNYSYNGTDDDDYSDYSTTKKYSYSDSSRAWMNAGVVISVIGLVGMAFSPMPVLFSEEDSAYDATFITLGVTSGVAFIGLTFMLGAAISAKQYALYDDGDTKITINPLYPMGLKIEF